MSLANLRPGAAGNYTTLVLGAGGSTTAAVDPGEPLSHDDDTSYIVVSGGSGPGTYRSSFTILAASIPAAIGIVSSVSPTSRGRRAEADGGLDSYRAGVRRGGTDVEDSAGGTGTAYANRAFVAARPGGGSWVPADITTGLEVIGRVDLAGDSASPDVRHTSLWLSLNYEPPAGGFASLVCQWLGPLVAVGLHEIPHVAAAIFRRSRGDMTIEPNEYARVYRELRDGRYARHFDLAGA